MDGSLPLLSCCAADCDLLVIVLLHPAVGWNQGRDKPGMDNPGMTIAGHGGPHVPYARIRHRLRHGLPELSEITVTVQIQCVTDCRAKAREAHSDKVIR